MPTVPYAVSGNWSQKIKCEKITRRRTDRRVNFYSLVIVPITYRPGIKFTKNPADAVPVQKQRLGMPGLTSISPPKRSNRHDAKINYLMLFKGFLALARF
jgi:hypothetical protein